MNVHTNPQLLFIQAFQDGIVPAMMYVPGQISGLWDNCVNITIEPHQDFVKVPAIQAWPPFRGHGGRALNWLCALADQHRIVLKGYVQPFGNDVQSPLYKPHVLKNFYLRRGFVAPDGGMSVIRHPS